MRPNQSLMALEGLSQEAISFQSTQFFDELTEAIENAWAKNFRLSYKDIIKQPEVLAILAVIKKHTGLTLEYSPRGPGYPAILSAPVSANHIFYTEWVGNHPEITQLIFKNTKDARKQFVKGSVDIRNAKVTGYFAELTHEFFLTTDLLSNGSIMGSRWTARQLAAVILHETGHAFTFMEMLVRTVTSNYVLAWLSTVRSESKPDEYKLAVEKFGKKEAWTPEQIEAFQNAEKQEDLAVLTIAETHRKARAELGINYYDSTSCEQMADQFAARFGAGRDLITALDAYGSYRPRGKNTYIVEAMLRACGYAFGLFAMPLFFVVLALLDGLEIAATINLPSAGTYDDDSTRTARVKHDMIYRLKQTQLSASEKKTLIEDIEFLDQMERKAVSYPGLHQRIALLISSSYTKKYNFTQLQKNLEALAASNIHVKAEKISSLIQ